MFWEYFRHLPDEGKTRSAIASDPEYAKAVADSLSEETLAEISERKPEDVELPIEGYTRVNAQMDDLKDSIESLRLTMVGLFSSKKKNMDQKPTKRPESALQKEIKRRVWEHERAESHDMLSDFGF